MSFWHSLQGFFPLWIVAVLGACGNWEPPRYWYGCGLKICSLACHCHSQIVEKGIRGQWLLEWVVQHPSRAGGLHQPAGLSEILSSFSGCNSFNWLISIPNSALSVTVRKGFVLVGRMMLSESVGTLKVWTTLVWKCGSCLFISLLNKCWISKAGAAMVTMLAHMIITKGLAGSLHLTMFNIICCLHRSTRTTWLRLSLSQYQLHPLCQGFSRHVQKQNMGLATYIQLLMDHHALFVVCPPVAMTGRLFQCVLLALHVFCILPEGLPAMQCQTSLQQHFNSSCMTLWHGTVSKLIVLWYNLICSANHQVRTARTPKVVELGCLERWSSTRSEQNVMQVEGPVEILYRRAIGLRAECTKSLSNNDAPCITVAVTKVTW